MYRTAKDLHHRTLERAPRPWGTRRADREPPAPHWFRAHVWTRPDRRQVRDLSRAAIAEYRASKTVSVVMPTAQHRRCATWLWS